MDIFSDLELVNRIDGKDYGYLDYPDLSDYTCWSKDEISDLLLTEE